MRGWGVSFNQTIFEKFTYQVHVIFVNAFQYVLSNARQKNLKAS